MKRPRIIPCLLIQNGALVKTVRFREPRYVGDPLNAVRIFNEKKADEIFVLDIDATVKKRKFDLTLAKNIADECQMPLTIGGGFSQIDEITQLIEMGVEKVLISAAAVADPSLVSKAAMTVGSQSIAVALDIRSLDGEEPHQSVTHHGRNKTGLNAIDGVKMMQDAGAGEIVLNSVDRDGTELGYDLDLIDKLKEDLRVPTTILGGAKNFKEMSDLVKRWPSFGAAAGTTFTFKGRLKAVLINYPTEVDRISLCRA